MIELENVRKEFRNVVAVRDLTLTIDTGCFFAFLGPNGAGKTTTIKMITGLLKPTRGRLRICGRDIQDEPMAARQLLSYVPDQPYLYDKLSGREFLLFVGRVYGMGKKELERNIGALSERFELESFLDHLGETYSHGMKQRVVIAAALLHDPSVIVIDEPMVGLDPKSSRIVKDVLRQRAAAGVTVFMSTHTLSVAEELADRIAIIRQGEVIADGTLEEIYQASQAGGQLEDAFLKLTEELEAEEEIPP
jgi:ABC-2 type transport system ATP-binding protein